MGLIISSNSKISPFGKRLRSDIFSERHFLDGFVSQLMCAMPRHYALHAIFNNTLAMDTLLLHLHNSDNFMLGEWMDNLDYFSLENKVRSSLLESTMEYSPGNKISFAALFFDLIDEFHRDDFFNAWERRLESEIILFLNSSSLRATLPELSAVMDLGNNFIETRAYYSPQATYAHVLTTTEENHNVGSPFEAVVVRDQSHLPSTVRQALYNCDELVIPQIVQISPWLLPFICFVESMPISVTIGRLVRKSRFVQFPIIYSNRHFEVVSGMKRESLIGNNASFLQTNRTLRLPQQNEVMHQFVTAISGGKTHIAHILSSDMTQELFRNCVGACPVADKTGMVRFVITLQIDARRSPNVNDNLALVKRLIDILPSHNVVNQSSKQC